MRLTCEFSSLGGICFDAGHRASSGVRRWHAQRPNSGEMEVERPPSVDTAAWAQMDPQMRMVVHSACKGYNEQWIAYIKGITDQWW